MDPSTAAAAATPTGLTAWVMANGQILLFFAQLAWWLCTAVFLGYAVAQYKRWVNFQLGIGHSGRLRAVEADEPADDTDVNVDEFVE